MAQEIIANIIANNRGLIKDADTFRRTMRGKDGLGYPCVSDEEINVLYMFYVMEVSDNG